MSWKLRGPTPEKGVSPVVAVSDATALGRTASVVGQRSNVDNFGHFDTSSVDGADCRFASVAGTFDIGFYLAETEVVGDFSAVLRCHLCGIRSVFLGASEAHLACA